MRHMGQVMYSHHVPSRVVPAQKHPAVASSTFALLFMVTCYDLNRATTNAPVSLVVNKSKQATTAVRGSMTSRSVNQPVE